MAGAREADDFSAVLPEANYLLDSGECNQSRASRSFVLVFISFWPILHMHRKALILKKQLLLSLSYSEEDNAHSMADEDEGDNPDQIRDQDRFLPIANVAKIMKDR